MAFRDDNEALRERVEGLEQRLADSEAEIARLRGEGAGAEDVAPSIARLERELPHALTDAGLVALADVVRERLGLELTQVGRTLRARDAAGTEVEIVAADRTTIRVRGEWSALARRGKTIAIAATGLASLPTLGVALDLHSRGVSPLFVAWVLPAVALGSAWWGRRRAEKQARAALERHRGAFEALVSVAATHATTHEAPKVRVEHAPADSETIESTYESEASESEASES